MRALAFCVLIQLRRQHPKCTIAGVRFPRHRAWGSTLMTNLSIQNALGECRRGPLPQNQSSSCPGIADRKHQGKASTERLLSDNDPDDTSGPLRGTPHRSTTSRFVGRVDSPDNDEVRALPGFSGFRLEAISAMVVVKPKATARLLIKLMRNRQCDVTQLCGRRRLVSGQSSVMIPVIEIRS